MAGFGYLHFDQDALVYTMTFNTTKGIRIQALHKSDLELGSVSIPFLRFTYQETSNRLVIDAKQIRNALRHCVTNPCGIITHFSWPAMAELFRLAQRSPNELFYLYESSYIQMNDPLKRRYLPERMSLTQNKKNQDVGTDRCTSAYHMDMSVPSIYYNNTEAVPDARLQANIPTAPVVVFMSSKEDRTTPLFASVCHTCIEIALLPSTRTRVNPFKKGYISLVSLQSKVAHASDTTIKKRRTDTATSRPFSIATWIDAIKSQFSVHILAGHWVAHHCRVSLHALLPYKQHEHLQAIADLFYISPWLFTCTPLRFGVSMNAMFNAKLTDASHVLFCNMIYLVQSDTKPAYKTSRDYCAILQQHGYRSFRTDDLEVVEGMRKFKVSAIEIPDLLRPWVVSATNLASQENLYFEYGVDKAKLHRPLYCHIVGTVSRMLDWRRVLFMKLVRADYIHIKICPTAPKDGIILPAMIPYSHAPSLDACRCIPDQLNSLVNIPDEVNICIHDAHRISWELLYMIWRRMVRHLQYNANIHCADFDTAESLRARIRQCNTTPKLVFLLQGSVTLARNLHIPNYASHNRERRVPSGADFLQLFKLPQTRIIRKPYMTNYTEHNTSMLAEVNDDEFIKTCRSAPEQVVLHEHLYYTDIDLLLTSIDALE